MSLFQNHQSCFYQAVENPSPSDSKMDIKVSCPMLTVKLRYDLNISVVGHVDYKQIESINVSYLLFSVR